MCLLKCTVIPLPFHRTDAPMTEFSAADQATDITINRSNMKNDVGQPWMTFRRILCLASSSEATWKSMICVDKHSELKLRSVRSGELSPRSHRCPAVTKKSGARHEDKCAGRPEDDNQQQCILTQRALRCWYMLDFMWNNLSFLIIFSVFWAIYM